MLIPSKIWFPTPILPPWFLFYLLLRHWMLSLYCSILSGRHLNVRLVNCLHKLAFAQTYFCLVIDHEVTQPFQWKYRHTILIDIIMKECFTKRKIPNLLVTMKVPLSLILQQYEHFLRSQFYFFQILNLLLLLIYEFRPHLMLKLHVPIIKIYEEKFLRYFGSNNTENIKTWKCLWLGHLPHWVVHLILLYLVEDVLWHFLIVQFLVGPDLGLVLNFDFCKRLKNS